MPLYSCCIRWYLPLVVSSDPAKEKLFGLWCVLSTVANHFLWNSPFYETDHRINFLVGLLFAVQVGTFIEVVLYTKKHPELPFLKQ